MFIYIFIYLTRINAFIQQRSIRNAQYWCVQILGLGTRILAWPNSPVNGRKHSRRDEHKKKILYYWTSWNSSNTQQKHEKTISFTAPAVQMETNTICIFSQRNFLLLSAFPSLLRFSPQVGTCFIAWAFVHHRLMDIFCHLQFYCLVSCENGVIRFDPSTVACIH